MPAAAGAVADGPLHEENDWGIEVVPDQAPTSSGDNDAAGSSSSAAGSSALPSGLTFALPESGGLSAATLAAEGLTTSDASVDDLAAMLAGLSGK